MPRTRHRVRLCGDTRPGKTVSEHFIGTGKACGPGAGSQTAPGLGRGELWMMEGPAGGFFAAAAAGGVEARQQ